MHPQNAKHSLDLQGWYGKPETPLCFGSMIPTSQSKEAPAFWILGDALALLFDRSNDRTRMARLVHICSTYDSPKPQNKRARDK